MIKDHDGEFVKLAEEDSQDIELQDTNMSKIINDKEPLPSTRLRDFKVTSNLWILAALLASVLFATCNMFIGKTSHHGINSRIFVGVGNMIAGILCIVSTSIYNIYKNNPTLIDLTCFWDSETDSLRWRLPLAILGDAILSGIGIYIIVLAFQTALYADMNQGVISTLFSFTAVFLSIFAWIIFGEKLNGYQITGVVALIGCVIFFAFSSDKSQGSVVVVEDQKIGVYSTLIPIGFALLCTMYFLVRTLMSKAYSIKFGISAPMFFSYSAILGGIVFSIVAVVKIADGSIDLNELKLMRDAVIGGVFQGFGGFSIYYACTTGYVGPASALVGVQSIIQTVLDLVLLGQIPNSFEVIGLVLGVLGTLAITIGPNVVGLMKTCPN